MCDTLNTLARLSCCNTLHRKEYIEKHLPPLSKFGGYCGTGILHVTRVKDSSITLHCPNRSEALTLLIYINLVDMRLIRCIYSILFIGAASGWHLSASHVIYLIRINILFRLPKFPSSVSDMWSGLRKPETEKNEIRKSIRLFELLRVVIFFFARLSAFWNYWEMHFGLKSKYFHLWEIERPTTTDYSHNLCYSFLECVNTCFVWPLSSVRWLRLASTVSVLSKQCRWDNDGGDDHGTHSLDSHVKM